MPDSEGTVAGGEVPRGPGGQCGSTVGAPAAHPNFNRLSGVDLLLGQKYFIGILRVEAEKRTSVHSAASVMSALRG